jgi:uncharacterized protein YjbI with pentapeptide repeats
MRWPDWTGVGERIWDHPGGKDVQPSKTAWDWLQLLIVPAVLAGGLAFYQHVQSDRQQRQQDALTRLSLSQAVEANQNSLFQSYVDKMSALVGDLLVSKSTDAIRQVASDLTSGFVSTMDGRRRGEVVVFLQDSHLLGDSTASHPLPRLVDLSHADLGGADLKGADLRGADLTGAQLTGAQLTGARLNYVDLDGATLDQASLNDAILDSANLTGATLHGANLDGARLFGSILTNADLTNANLTNATLSNAKFSNTMCPDGKVHHRGCPAETSPGSGG